jgi:hypothetical protein
MGVVPVPDADAGDDDALILEVAVQVEVAGAVLTVCPEPLAAQRLADRAGVSGATDAVLQEAERSRADLPVESAQFARGIPKEINGLRHVRA